MSQKCVTGLIVLVISANCADGATLHRLPLPYIPYPISAWKDDSGSYTDGVTIRYDGYNLTSTSYAYDGHRGTDFAAPYGATVYLSAKGTVYDKNSACDPNGGYIGNTCGYGWGNYVAVTHADGVVSIYGHLSSPSSAFSIGTFLSCTSGPGGTFVGYSGNSGSTSGPHLHFELRLSNLSKASPSYEPFAGVSSTQNFEYWYQYALVDDPVQPGHTIHYPATNCQP